MRKGVVPERDLYGMLAIVPVLPEEQQYLLPEAVGQLFDATTRILSNDSDALRILADDCQCQWCRISEGNYLYYAALDGLQMFGAGPSFCQ